MRGFTITTYIRSHIVTKDVEQHRDQMVIREAATVLFLEALPKADVAGQVLSPAALGEIVEGRPVLELHLCGSTLMAKEHITPKL